MLFSVDFNLHLHAIKFSEDLTEWFIWRVLLIPDKK